MLVFGYGRVSTSLQTVENQRLELINAGYKIDCWFADEGVSGKVCANQRPKFVELPSGSIPKLECLCRLFPIKLHKQHDTTAHMENRLTMLV